MNNHYCNICTDECAVDVFTITHFIAGMIMYQLNFGLITTNLLHAVYEILNHLPSNDQMITGCEKLRKYFPVIPHCKLNPVVWSNSLRRSNCSPI